MQTNLVKGKQFMNTS